MIGEYGIIMVEAKTACGAAEAGTVQTFEAQPLLLSDGGSPTINKSVEAFDVCNTSRKRICAGDRMPVTKTIQGHFITVSMDVGRAMSVVFEKTSSGWDVSKFWEGEDPEVCGVPDVECLFDCSCLKDGDLVYARYSPEDDKYYALSSASAMIGPPESKNVVIGLGSQNCDIRYTSQTIKAWTCDEEPTTGYVGLPIEQVPVVTGILYSNSGIHIATGYVYVCASSAGPNSTIPFTDCEEPECSGYCTWKWQGDSWEDTEGKWLLTESCEQAECNCAEPLYPPQYEWDTTRTHDCGQPAPPAPTCADASCLYMWTKDQGETFAPFDDPEAEWYQVRGCPKGCECAAAPTEPPANAEADFLISHQCTDK